LDARYRQLIVELRLDLAVGGTSASIDDACDLAHSRRKFAELGGLRPIIGFEQLGQAWLAGEETPKLIGKLLQGAPEEIVGELLDCDLAGERIGQRRSIKDAFALSASLLNQHALADQTIEKRANRRIG